MVRLASRDGRCSCLGRLDDPCTGGQGSFPIGVTLMLYSSLNTLIYENCNMALINSNIGQESDIRR